MSNLMKKNRPENQVHTIEPVYDSDSRILILGSFPSVKSREAGFFYGHPQNRFWKVLAGLCETETPVTTEQKKDFLLQNHIAVWDVIASCVITGSSDSSIRQAVPNDLDRILKMAPVSCIYCNGGTAYRLYQRYLYSQTGREAVKLPSTSPANASWSLEKLMEAWKICLSFMGKGV